MIISCEFLNKKGMYIVVWNNISGQAMIFFLCEILSFLCLRREITSTVRLECKLYFKIIYFFYNADKHSFTFHSFC